MARRRLRGRNFRWGAGFDGQSPFSGAKLKALSDHCHDFIEAARLASPVPGGFRVGRYAFEMFRHGFLLRFEARDGAWVLDIVSWPPVGGRRTTSRAERANGDTQSSDKRNLYSPMLKFVRSHSQQLRVDSDCPRLFDCGWLADRVRYKAA
jgi:hypothetical protein